MKSVMNQQWSPIRVQKLIVFVSITLFVVKLFAWKLTNSVAIMTDALESTVNVIASLIGLYSIILASKPKDAEHPYGHGKVEFISSALEGLLILIAGVLILIEAVRGLFLPKELKQLDIGMLLMITTAFINFIVGWFCLRKGRKENSPILLASGSHLLTDTYSTLGILTGITCLWITGYKWIDNGIALLFSGFILITGYKIIRRSISGIMDEKDVVIINEIIDVLKTNRNEKWIDIHNMRVIDYAGFYHIDCHLTVQYYISVNEAHEVLDRLTQLLQAHFNNQVEFFIHIDGCIPELQCGICNVKNCSKRIKQFEGYIEWNHANILHNQKHLIKS